MAQLSDGDSEWRVETVEWDPVEMVVGDTRGAKRASPSRAANTSCQVEGCPQQLLPLRSYYQRQHICEEHFKAVTITDASGRTLRFCQQCTKLELLECFDGNRKSCRASLERRNQRRAGRRRGGGAHRNKKPAAAAAAGTASGSGSGSGSTVVLPQHVLASSPTSSEPADAHASAAKRQKAVVSGVSHMPRAPIEGYWVQPVAAADPALGRRVLAGPSPLPHQAHPHNASAPTAYQGGDLTMQQPIVSMKQAVQLTGMPPLKGLSELDVDELLAMDPDCLADAIMASGDLRPPRGGPSNSAANSAAVPNQALPALLPQHGEWHPAGPLTALAPPAFSGQTVMPVAPPPPSLQQLVAADLRVPPAQLAMPLAQAQPGLLSSMFGSLPPEAFGLSAADAVAAETMLGDLPPGEAADLETLLLGLTPQSEEVRISLKLYGVHPDQLPPQLRADLFTALALPYTAVQATLRSGCVHLTLAVLSIAEEARRLKAPGAAAAAAARLVPLVRSLPSRRLALQVEGGSAALLAQPTGNGPAVLLSIPVDAGELPPAVSLLQPLARVASTAGGHFHLRCPAALLHGGSGLALHCRHSDAHVAVSLTPAGAAPVEPPADGIEQSDEEDVEEEQAEQAAAGDPDELVDVEAWVPAAAGEHFWGVLYEFEVARGALLSSSTPVLLLPDSQAAAATELARLAPGPHSAAVLRLVAQVLRYLQLRHAAAGSASAQAAQARQFPPLAVALIAAAAETLLELCYRAGWPALASLLTPAAAAATAAATAAPPSPAVAPAEGSSIRKLYTAPPLGKSAAASPDRSTAGGKLGQQPLVPDLSKGDGLRCVMHPAVLGAATLLVAGCMLGVGIALLTGALQ